MNTQTLCSAGVLSSYQIILIVAAWAATTQIAFLGFPAMRSQVAAGGAAGSSAALAAYVIGKPLIDLAGWALTGGLVGYAIVGSLVSIFGGRRV